MLRFSTFHPFLVPQDCIFHLLGHDEQDEQREQEAYHPRRQIDGDAQLTGLEPLAQGVQTGIEPIQKAVHDPINLQI